MNDYKLKVLAAIADFQAKAPCKRRFGRQNEKRLLQANSGEIVAGRAIRGTLQGITGKNIRGAR